MNTFILCEKPSQARMLAKVLGASKGDDGAFVGNGVTIGAAAGHMLNLAMPDDYIGEGRWSLNSLPVLPQNWVWKVSDKHREQYDKIGAWMKHADAVIIATDPDEEGEVIGRQIVQAHGYTGKVSRLWANALDPVSLEKALQNLLPLSATEAYYNAGRVRRELDWLFGTNLSRAFSVMYDRTTHVGRVKTRLLYELVQRDREIAQFVPKVYSTAVAHVGDAMLEWQAGGSVHDERGLYALQNVGNGVCLSSTLTEEVMAPPLPFTLSALLSAASDKGISLADGYSAAQSLYEAGAISYPRAGSTALPGAGGFASHHAIINTMDACPSWMSADAQTIFRMVRLNGVMQDIGAASIMVRRLTFDFGGEVFTAEDRWVDPDKAAWLHCDPARFDRLTANRKATEFKVGDKVSGVIQVERKVTQAPEKFSEASMLRMMASAGIGTEATRVESITGMVRDRVADVAEPVDERGMALKKSLFIGSTGVGREMIRKLPEAVTGPAMEQQMRKALDAVRGGQSDFSGHLLSATKWIARTIHAENAARA